MLQPDVSTYTTGRIGPYNRSYRLIQPDVSAYTTGCMNPNNASLLSPQRIKANLHTAFSLVHQPSFQTVCH
jgi:hypothetical protein